MDTWNQYDPSVPEPLHITTLPNTIECIMLEDTGTTIVRCMSRPIRTKTTPEHKDSRPLVDNICKFCGTHGHETPNCDFKAKWITVQEAIKSVDPKAKEKLKESYKQEQQRKRSRKLKKKVQVIRKLIHTDGDPSEVDALLATIPPLMDQDQDDESISDSKSSTTSGSTDSDAN
jgi:hypothetical protein